MEEKNDITHQALWYWVRKFRNFRESLHRIVAERGGIPEVIVVDETGRSLRPHKEQYICGSL